jgi:hypothetical protein
MTLILSSKRKALARIAEAIARIRDRLTGARDRYRPEKHCMRGPGPGTKRSGANKQE